MPHVLTCSSRFPARKEGLPAIEEAIFAGVSVNVTLLFSREHYLAEAEAYLRGIERRIEAGLHPSNVSSVASVFISRWDVAVIEKVPEALRDKLGIAMAARIYKTYRDMLDSPRWQAIKNGGLQSATAFVCQHRNQGPEGLRRAVHQEPWRRQTPSTRCRRAR